MKQLRDTTDGVIVPVAIFQQHGNETNTLGCVWAGLQLLNKEISQGEEKARTNAPGEVTFTFGNGPIFRGVNIPIVVNVFHWYAVSVCNFVRLIGWFRAKANPASPNPQVFLESVLPDVKVFRDKVAAHFARTSGPGRDNEAEREASVISTIGWLDNRIIMPGMHLRIRRAGEESDSSDIASWSVTRTHEMLTSRFVFEEAPASQGAPH